MSETTELKVVVKRPRPVRLGKFDILNILCKKNNLLIKSIFNSILLLYLLTILILTLTEALIYFLTFRHVTIL